MEKKKKTNSPQWRPDKNATPIIDISIVFGRSTGRPVKSANSWSTKSFFETPPSTLKRQYKPNNY